MLPFVIEENKWRLVSDPECYVLQEARTVKGNLKWGAEGYYVTLADALEGCLRKSVRQSREDLPSALREAVECVSTAVDRLRQGLTMRVEVPNRDGSIQQQLVLL